MWLKIPQYRNGANEAWIKVMLADNLVLIFNSSISSVVQSISLYNVQCTMYIVRIPSDCKFGAARFLFTRVCSTNSFSPLFHPFYVAGIIFRLFRYARCSSPHPCQWASALQWVSGQSFELHSVSSRLASLFSHLCCLLSWDPPFLISPFPDITLSWYHPLLISPFPACSSYLISCHPWHPQTQFPRYFARYHATPPSPSLPHPMITSPPLLCSPMHAFFPSTPRMESRELVAIKWERDL